MGDFGHMKQGVLRRIILSVGFCRGNETNRQMGFQVDKTCVPPATGTLHWRCLVFGGSLKGGGGSSTWTFLPKQYFVIEALHLKNVVSFFF